MDSSEKLDEILINMIFPSLQFISKLTITCFVKLLFKRLKNEFASLVDLLNFDIFIRDQFMYIVKRFMDMVSDELVEIDRSLSAMNHINILEAIELNQELDYIDEYMRLRVLVEKLLRVIFRAFEYLHEPLNQDYITVTYT